MKNLEIEKKFVILNFFRFPLRLSNRNSFQFAKTTKFLEIKEVLIIQDYKNVIKKLSLFTSLNKYKAKAQVFFHIIFCLYIETSEGFYKHNF